MDAPGAGRPAVSGPGPADAGAVVHRAHPAGLLRHRVPGADPVRASGATCAPATRSSARSRGGGRGCWSRCSRPAWSPARSCASRWACCGRSSRRRSAACSGSASRSRASRSSSRRSSSASTSTAGTGCSPRLHFLSGLPIAIAGVLGSFMVITVNGWMNHPQGFTIVDGQVTDVAPVPGAVRQHLLLARVRAHVPGRLHGRPASCVAGCYAVGRLRGTPSRYVRVALAVPLTAAAVAAPVQVLVGDWAARDVGDRPADQARRAGRAGPDHPRRAGAPPRLVHRRRGALTASASRGCSRCWPCTTRTPPSRG